MKKNHCLQRLTVGFGLLMLPFVTYGNIIDHCAHSKNLEVHCGYPRIEDMAAITGSPHIIFAEFGGPHQEPGKLGVYSPQTKTYRQLFQQKNKALILGKNWGDDNCQWPNVLSPHGIHLSARANGQQQLLVVNHGEQDQVLFFELTGNSPETYALHAKGCVTFPAFAHLNDVVALNNGDFAVTHMFQANQKRMSQLKAILGYSTGFVYHWNQHTGLTVLDDSDGIFPNGIEANAQKDLLFINMYLGHEVKIYSLKKHQYINHIPVESPDNSSWSVSGELLVASHQTSWNKILSCLDIEKGSCGGAFDIIAINTQTGSTRNVFHAKGGEGFGPATIAIEFHSEAGAQLLMGSFSGDRIAYSREATLKNKDFTHPDS